MAGHKAPGDEPPEVNADKKAGSEPRVLPFRGREESPGRAGKMCMPIHMEHAGNSGPRVSWLWNPATAMPASTGACCTQSLGSQGHPSAVPTSWLDSEVCHRALGFPQASTVAKGVHSAELA